MLTGMNVSRGAFRLWVVATVLWFAFVTFTTWDEVSDTARGSYEYFSIPKSPVRSFDGEDSKLSPSEIYEKPTQRESAPTFGLISSRNQSIFDRYVESGSWKIHKFPDGTSLYLVAGFEKSEENFLIRSFWAERQQRGLHALQQKALLIMLALVPPLLLLIIWFVSRWVLAGFRQA